MPNQKNQTQLESLKTKIGRAKSAAIVDYQGLSVNELTQLRSDLKAAGGEFLVTKNTLLHLGFDKAPALKEDLSGMNALILSYDDEVGAIKVAVKFRDDAEGEKLILKSGYLDGEIISADAVGDLSKLPTKTELLAKLVYLINAPGKNLAGVLKANVRDLTYALQAIANKKGGEVA